MPIRNPFARVRPGLTISTDENARSDSAVSNKDAAHPGFERVDTVGSKASSAISVRSSRSQDNGEYKMSVVNDSGVYLPPSPVEKEAAWPRRYLASRTSTDTKSSIGGGAGAGSGEIEHFSISRESFDSYRRSFDVSARTPVIANDTAPRQSLDSRFPRLPYHRSSLAERRPAVPATAVEESNFEDVGLNDENSKPQSQQQQQPKKRSFFSKFGSDDSSDAPANAGSGQTQPQQHAGIASRFLGGSRKRGQSGQGAELGVMPLERPKTASTVVETEVQS